jgi:translation initiation factor 2 alpha subunit (eIF-2alpha)
MFWDKVFHAELKEDEAVVNMVLDVTTRSQNLRLVLPWEKEPRKTKTTEDWQKEEQLWKTFDSII